MTMAGVVVVTHGRLAEDLVEAARTIVGSAEGLEPVSIDWDDDVAEARRRIEEGVQRVGAENGVLVLTDMFGGTPTNIALSMLDPGRLEVVTGVNLPMLIKFLNLRDAPDLGEIARRLADQGRDAIHVASDLLERPSAARSGEPT